MKKHINLKIKNGHINTENDRPKVVNLPYFISRGGLCFV